MAHEQIKEQIDKFRKRPKCAHEFSTGYLREISDLVADRHNRMDIAIQ